MNDYSMMAASMLSDDISAGNQCCLRSNFTTLGVKNFTRRRRCPRKNETTRCCQAGNKLFRRCFQTGRKEHMKTVTWSGNPFGHFQAELLPRHCAYLAARCFKEMAVRETFAIGFKQTNPTKKVSDLTHILPLAQ